jgi:hypothetical protein
MPTAQPSVRDAWIDLVYERLGATKLDRVACWHRAAGWWSLQLDHEDPYVLYACDDGRLHVNWRGSVADLPTVHAGVVADVLSSTPLADADAHRCVLALQPDAAAHPTAPAFVDSILTREHPFA